MTKLPCFTCAFLHPRYWLIWAGVISLWCLVKLPYPILSRIGGVLGRVGLKFQPRRLMIARRNLALCFPEMNVDQRERLLQQNIDSVGMGVIETGIAWFWPDWRIKKWFTLSGYEHMAQARQQEKGVLLIGMHFLTLELGARIFGMLNPGIGVYRPNNNALLDWLQNWGRLRSNKSMLDRHDLKSMIRALKQSEIIWYAPDHDYGRHNSVFVPFFAVPDAATTVGSYMLIKSAQPAVIPFVPRRKPNGAGYELIILPDISSQLSTDSKESVASEINKAIEHAIMMAPAQYMWLHRRFKTRPEGQVSLYDKKISSEWMAPTSDNVISDNFEQGSALEPK